LRVLVSRWIR